jgi:hypothetical protein
LKAGIYFERYLPTSSPKLMKIPLLIGLLASTQIQAASFLIETEQFADKGGWGV